MTTEYWQVRDTWYGNHHIFHGSWDYKYLGVNVDSMLDWAQEGPQLSALSAGALLIRPSHAKDVAASGRCVLEQQGEDSRRQHNQEAHQKKEKKKKLIKKAGSILGA